ncbi:MAG: hypothetical protein KC413_00255, partial [Anaerolineales bacterium]|nr:hypothetical protein [Anaerolineales bacterium]
ANSRAVAAPIPDAPPVTMAILSVKSMMPSNLLRIQQSTVGARRLATPTHKRPILPTSASPPGKTTIRLAASPGLQNNGLVGPILGDAGGGKAMRQTKSLATCLAPTIDLV